ncbi:MAG: Uma2 family endonuclease [Bryobacteraceae bacterium]
MLAVHTPSVEQFLRGGARERCELVRGHILEKATPAFEHSRIQGLLTHALAGYGEKRGRGIACPEWHHRFGPPGDLRIYVPDIAFLKAPPEHVAAYADAASDVMIEILSPSDSHTELLDKVQFYLYGGAESVWVVDPERKRIHIYKSGAPVRRFVQPEILTDPALPGFELPLANLFPA